MKPLLCLTTLVLATVACNACGDPPPPDGHSPALEAAVRDSADIRIVENPRPPSQSRLDWRVGTEPAVSIGEREGEGPYLLHRARDAFIMPDGRIVVANTGSHELRVFDAAGIHVATWGRRGEGPGEFNPLVQVHPWRGDSLLALYSPAHHLSVLDSEGNVGRTFTLARDDSFFQVEAVLPVGAILSSDLLPRSLDDGLNRSEETYRVKNAEGDDAVPAGVLSRNGVVQLPGAGPAAGAPRFRMRTAFPPSPGATWWPLPPTTPMKSGSSASTGR